MTEVTVDLTGEGDPEKVSVAAVSAPYFEVFGARPLHGRTFEAGENTVGGNRVVILGHAFWRQRFGGDPGVVNRSVMLNGSPMQGRRRAAGECRLSQHGSTALLCRS